MNNCELCSGPEEVGLKSMMLDKLRERGIAAEDFVKGTPRERLDFLIEKFNLVYETNLPTYNSDRVSPFLKGDLGIVIIKPEIYRESARVENYLEKTLGLEKITSSDFTYLPEEYWAIYGETFINNFEEFPHGSLLFLLSVTLPSKLIVFRHHSADYYLSLFQRLNGFKPLNQSTVAETNDRQFIFYELFVKYPGNSLRTTVCWEEVRKRGLSAMDNSNSCPVVCWDFTGTFGDRSEEDNLRTFNGVHSPRNQAELLLNVAILSSVELELDKQ